VIPLYTVTPLQGVQNALVKLGSSATASLTIVADDNSNLADAVAAAKNADVVIVLAGTIAEEGADRTSIAMSNNQDAIVTAVAAANPRTAVVLKDNASVLMPWVDKVPAILETWFPGQEDGNIAAELVFGIANPSGKLPVTFPKNDGDWPANTPAQYPGVSVNGVPTVTYSEGLNIGYRWYDARNVKPLFPFGYGLSYTTFALSNLQVTPQASDGTKPITVQVVVENTGKTYGAEVPQVYVGLPAAGQPPKRLVAFEKVWLNPGEKKTVQLTIDPASASHPLSTWDSNAQQWTTASGQYQVLVGNSSQNPALSGSLSISH
jgi:beta-glucosidase